MKKGSITRTDFVMIPALSQYSAEQQAHPNFDFMSIDTIWPRLQIANGKDVTEWHDVDNPSLVEKLILEALQRHFAQASDTIVTTPKWRSILTSKECQEQLLKGTFQWENDVPDEFRDMLMTFHVDSSNVKQIPFRLTYSAFTAFVQKSKEKTSTSPSSRHYGHYKALLQGAPEVLEDIFRLMKLSVENGIFLRRYKKTLTTLICKESGTPYLHRFRPIHIIEAELQFIAKSIWAKQMINNAEKNNNITDSQYGGRHGRQAQSSVLNTVLYYDIHRQLRKDFTSNDDDMKANFDREIPHYVAAEARSLGMSYEAGNFLVQATSSQEYYIRTSNGTSTENYTFTKERPIWGLGQGVGWAGACWQITATTISKCMNDNCLGIYLCCPLREISVEKLMDFFIDDTKKICNQVRAGLTLRQQTEYNMQKHTFYIATTGGSLALDKCTWYYVTFSFDSNGDPYILSKTELPGEIEVLKNFDGEKVQIKRLEFDQAHRSLGYFLSPDGNTDAHFTFTLDLVKKWKSKVTSSRLTSSQILKSYDSVLKRQLLYRLVATSFTYDQCNILMKQINPVLLHAAGLQEHSPRSISEAGAEYAGFDLTHLYNLHGQEKLQFFLMHIRKNDSTGKLLQIPQKHTQLQLGIGTPFFSTDYDAYSYLCQLTWLTHLWQYTSSCGLEIELTDSIVLDSPYENDRFIMDILLQSPAMTKQDCIVANKMRIAMRLLHLSDVVDGRGKRLLPDIRNGCNYRASKLEWPRQVQLKKWLPTWQKACGILQRFASKHHIHINQLSLHQNSIWTTDSSQKYVTNGTITYVKVYARTKTYFTLLRQKLPENIKCTTSIDISFTKNRPRIVYSYPPYPDFSPVQQESTTLYQLPILTSAWNKIFGALPDLSEDKEIEIIQGIQNGTIIIGLDGSVTKGLGAYSFGFFDQEASSIYMSHGLVHGDSDQQNSTRSEMHGILGAVLLLNILCSKYRPIGPFLPIHIIGDNVESLRVGKEGPSQTLKNVFSSDMDVSYEL